LVAGSSNASNGSQFGIAKLQLDLIFKGAME